MEERNSLTQEAIPNDDTDEPNKHFPHFNENGNHFSDVSHMQKLLESSGSEENTSVLPNRLKVGYSESPRTTLSRFIPESPFKINGNLCDSKIFMRPSLPNGGSRGFHVSLSMVDNDEDGTEIMFSKSCDCNEEIIQSLHNTPSMIRSVSEDILQTPAEELSRRISVVSSSKGKLMGVPRVRPGEKVVRSPSVSSQPPFKGTAGLGEEEEGALPKKVKFTSEQKWIAFCLCLVDFTAFLSMSIIAPFFPREVCGFS